MYHGLNRRRFLGLAALPAVVGHARAAGQKRLVFVPQAMPVSLDPIATPSFATRTAAMAVFDTLYGMDARLNPMPQMVDQHSMEDDGKRWIFQLRQGLLFHDGTKVTARDCVESLRRWMRRDRVGHALGARLDVIEAPSDDTIVLRLGKPLRRVTLMLTKSQMSPPVIMPARFANTSADSPVGSIVGSGPFRLTNLSWRPGDDLDLIRFENYAPRHEASSFTGGGRHALVNMVSWRTPNDPIQALRDGSVDWVEWLPPDFAGDTLGDPNLVVSRLDEVGYYALLRLNTLRGPTANQRIRQAILAGVDQTAVMETVFGADSGRFKTPIGLFPPDSEFASPVASGRIGGTQSPKAIKAMLKDSGYKGEPLVVLNPVDDAVHTRITGAVINELTQIGLSIDERKLDRKAFEAWRRRGQGSGHPPSEGDDWSALCDSLPAADHYDPFAISAGPPASGGAWPGWPDDPVAGRLRDAWIDAPDLRAERAVAAQLQTQVFTTVAFVPLGQWFPTTARRASVTGLQTGLFPVFWDVARP